jgi:hypothetical protein
MEGSWRGGEEAERGEGVGEQGRAGESRGEGGEEEEGGEGREQGLNFFADEGCPDKGKMVWVMRGDAARLRCLIFAIAEKRKGMPRAVEGNRNHGGGGEFCLRIWVGRWVA